MTIDVVDLLQPVEIDAEHGELLVGAGAGFDHLGQRLEESGAVRQVGQAVMVGHMRHPRLGLAPVGDVLMGLDQILRLAGVVEHGHAAGQEQPQAVLGRDRVLFRDHAALPDRSLVAGDDQLGFALVENVGGGQAGGVLAAAVEDRLGAAVGQEIAAVADALHDQGDRDVVDHELEKFLAVLEFARQRAAVGDVVEQRDQKFRLAGLVAGNDPVGSQDALLRTAFDHEFAAMIAFRRIQRRTVGGVDAGRGLRTENLVGALAHDVIARETGEALECAVGEDVAAVLDVLGRDADRNVVEHRFQELRGRGQLARQLALVGAIEMGRDRAAVRQRKIFHQHRLAARQFRDQPVRCRRPGKEILGADVEHAAVAAQLQQFGAGHVAPDIGARQTVDLQIAVVAEYDALAHVGHHHALVQMIEGRGDKGVAPQLGASGLAQCREDPEPDRAEEGGNHHAADQEFPNHAGIEVTEITRRCERAGGGPGCGGWRNSGNQAKDDPCRNRILPARLPLPASHQSPADFRGECPAPAVWIG